MNELFVETNRKLYDVRLIVGNRVFYMPIASVNVDRTKKDGSHAFKVYVPSWIGKEVEYKDVLVVGFVGQGKGIVAESREYNMVVAFEGRVRESGSIVVTIPMKYTYLFEIG